MLCVLAGMAWTLAAGTAAFPQAAKKEIQIIKTEHLGALTDWKSDDQAFKGSPQGLAIHGRTAVLMRDGGQVNLIDLKKKKVVSVYKADLGRAHCNNAGFGKEKVKGGLLPLLYVTECYGQRRCFMLDVRKDSARVVQEIYYEDPAYKGPLDWCVDPEEGFIYAYGGPLAGRFLKKFRLPALSDSDADGKVTFTDEDVLETVTFQDVRVPQGSMVRKGLAVIPQGCPPLERNLHFIDMATQEKLLVMDLSDFDIEPEGIDRKGNWIYLSFFSKDKEVNTNLYRIKIKVR